MPISRSSVNGTHTLAEILSQPDVWYSCLRTMQDGTAMQYALKAAHAQKEWLFVGCGTSFYLAEAAAASWTLMTGQRARAFPASELLLFPALALLDSPELHAVVVSRSGRTSEAVRVAELLARKHNVSTLGITCSPSSELTQTCDLTLTLPDADEKSMVMTRSFTSMLLLLLQLAAAKADQHGFSSALSSVAGALSARIVSFNDRVESFVARHSFADYIYLGQGPCFPLAREAALKITEMSHSYAQAYHTLEFRHGPKATVAPQTCLTFFLSESGMQAETDVLVEMKELGAVIIAVCNRASEPVRRSSDVVFELEASVPELALVAPFVVPAQLLGFHTAMKKGLNPDEPKNLSRVVLLD